MSESVLHLDKTPPRERVLLVDYQREDASIQRLTLRHLIRLEDDVAALPEADRAQFLELEAEALLRASEAVFRKARRLRKEAAAP